jgi:hypothetical protein
VAVQAGAGREVGAGGRSKKAGTGGENEIFLSTNEATILCFPYVLGSCVRLFSAGRVLGGVRGVVGGNVGDGGVAADFRGPSAKCFLRRMKPFLYDVFMRLISGSGAFAERVPGFGFRYKGSIEASAGAVYGRGYGCRSLKTIG